MNYIKKEENKQIIRKKNVHLTQRIFSPSRLNRLPQKRQHSPQRRKCYTSRRIGQIKIKKITVGIILCQKYETHRRVEC